MLYVGKVQIRSSKFRCKKHFLIFLTQIKPKALFTKLARNSVKFQASFPSLNLYKTHDYLRRGQILSPWWSPSLTLLVHVTKMPLSLVHLTAWRYGISWVYRCSSQWSLSVSSAPRSSVPFHVPPLEEVWQAITYPNWSCAQEEISNLGTFLI